jgi:hypothetical protein
MEEEEKERRRNVRIEETIAIFSNKATHHCGCHE